MTARMVPDVCSAALVGMQGPVLSCKRAPSAVLVVSLDGYETYLPYCQDHRADADEWARRQHRPYRWEVPQ